jgi:hypothetical protein
VRVMVRRLADRPERFGALRSRLEALASDEGVGARAERTVFARAASEAKPNEALALAARMLARAQARDAARHGDPDDLQTLRTLVTLSRDAALKEDVPTWPTFARVPLASRPAAWKRTITAADTGPRAVYDAVALRDGGALLALGEAGASLRDRDGRERARLDEPTHRIVWSDHENSALLLGARGTSWRVARLDVARATSSPWGECTLDCFAQDYDGDSWVVGQEGEVLALDATAGEMRAMAGPGRTPRTDHARVRCVGRDRTGVAAVRVLSVIERWRWSLPGWALQEKPLEPLRPADRVAVAVHPSGITARRSDSGAVEVDRGKSQPLVELPHPAGTQSEVTHLTSSQVGGGPALTGGGDGAALEPLGGSLAGGASAGGRHRGEGEDLRRGAHGLRRPGEGALAGPALRDGAARPAGVREIYFASRVWSISAKAVHTSTVVKMPTTFWFCITTTEPYLCCAISRTTSSTGVSGSTE